MPSMYVEASIVRLVLHKDMSFEMLRHDQKTEEGWHNPFLNQESRRHQSCCPAVAVAPGVDPPQKKTGWQHYHHPVGTPLVVKSSEPLEECWGPLSTSQIHSFSTKEETSSKPSNHGSLERESHPIQTSGGDAGIRSISSS